jgi:magnesium chelatase subunit I
VSARLPISGLETLVSNVERRAIATGERSPAPRLCDLFALIPAVTGKIELVYEGEQEGASIVAEKLIGKAIRTVFRRHFAPIHKESRKATASPETLYSKVQAWFAAGNSIDVTDFKPAAEERKSLMEVDGLEKLTRKYLKIEGDGELLAGMQLALEGMHQHSMLAKEGTHGVVTYGDMISRMMQDL